MYNRFKDTFWNKSLTFDNKHLYQILLLQFINFQIVLIETQYHISQLFANFQDQKRIPTVQSAIRPNITITTKQQIHVNCSEHVLLHHLLLS